MNINKDNDNPLIKFIKGEENFTTLIMGFLIFIGILIIFIFYTPPTNDGIDGPAKSNIYGYGIFVIVILCYIFMALSYKKKEQNDEKNEQNYDYIQIIKDIFNVIKEIIINTFQPVLLLIILIWYLYININYYTTINKGQVNESYNNYSGLFSFLIIIHIISLFTYLNKKDDDKQKTKILQFIYILFSFNFTILSIMHIIIKFYSTDG